MPSRTVARSTSGASGFRSGADGVIELTRADLRLHVYVKEVTGQFLSFESDEDDARHVLMAGASMMRIEKSPRPIIGITSHRLCPKIRKRTRHKVAHYHIRPYISCTLPTFWAKPVIDVIDYQTRHF